MKQAAEIVHEENTRRVMLEDCERKIMGFKRRGIDATIGIGLQLGKINELELYKEKDYDNLAAYCAEELQLEARSVTRILAIANSAQVFKAHDKELPINESHLAELGRVEAEQQPLVWERVNQYAGKNEMVITTALVREVVSDWQEEHKQPTAATKPKDGARSALEDPDLDLGSNLSDEQAKPSGGPLERPRINLSEDGEKALERIRRTCGDAVADSIEYLSLEIPEKELIQWNEEDHPERLIHCIMNLGYSVSKAKSFVDQTISGSTPARRLVLLAQVNGGQYKTELEQATITVLIH
jgi:hypothetical protein